jgi:hypothetical protein
LFVPVAFNLAETTRMIKTAKGIRQHDLAAKVFDFPFITDGGDLENLIDAEEGFPQQRMEPRLTDGKIENIVKVDKGEKLDSALTRQETIERSKNEVVTRGRLIRLL